MTAPPRPDLGWWWVVAWLCGAGFALTALFNAWPALDLAAAAAFHAPGEGFAQGATPLARGLRSAYQSVFTAACALALIGLAGRLARPKATRVPARLWLFPVLLFALGPGLMVNALLKERWGRARPAQIEAFGGDAAYSLPFEIADQCASNCSFVSGEGSSAAAAAAALIGLFWARLGAAGRIAAGVAAALWLAGAAFIRMAPGRHFLSDTLFAFLLMGLLAALLYRLLGLGRLRGAHGPADYLRDALGALGAAARGLRAAVARLRPPRGRAG